MKRKLKNLNLTVTKKKLSVLIDNWTYFVMKTADRILTEDEFLILIKLEIDNFNRGYMVKRLYGKYATLRKERELEELQDLTGQEM